MKVALIGDVHANLPALEAVLTDASQRGAEAIWNVGDSLGYGAFPDEVVRLLRTKNVLSILGNYDLKVLKFKRKQGKWRKSKHPLKFHAFQWAHEQLSKSSRKYLRALPQEMRLTAAGRCVLLTHGSPASNEEPLTADTSETRLRELIQMADAEVIVCGHSHQAFDRVLDAVWFINAGSVGRPDDGDPRTGYALLDLEPDRLQVCHLRLAYDVARAVAQIRYHGLPEAYAQMTLQGRSLDEISDE